VKRALRIYNATRKQLSAVYSAKLHPRKGIKGFAVVNGQPKLIYKT
jgi:hypothetical protein